MGNWSLILLGNSGSWCKTYSSEIAPLRHQVKRESGYLCTDSGPSPDGDRKGSEVGDFNSPVPLACQSKQKLAPMLERAPWQKDLEAGSWTSGYRAERWKGSREYK